MKFAQIRQPKTTRCMTFGSGAKDGAIKVQSSCRISSFGRYLTQVEREAKTDKLQIGSFNIQIFGRNKMKEIDVVKVLLRIVENKNVSNGGIVLKTVVAKLK